jgi:hypothetical protein
MTDTSIDALSGRTSNGMPTDRQQRDRVAAQGRIAVVPGADEERAEYWLLSEDGEEFPIEASDVGDVYAVLSRLRDRQVDDGVVSDPVEITCHECGKTWQHTGSGDRATCPNCETTTPVEGIGP